MDILELTERAVELASRDDELREKTTDTVATIVMVLKNGEDTPLTMLVDRRDLWFSQGAVEGPDFQFEISKENFTKLMTGKAAPLILFATKELKMVKGSWEEINKIAGALAMVLKKGKEIAEK
ncbi:MAG: SCP2 sterol-binding domain-containing protein [Candidatus Hadarchaeaceae archaeon]